MNYTVVLQRAHRMGMVPKADIAIVQTECPGVADDQEQAKLALKAAMIDLLESDNADLENGRYVRTEDDYTLICVVAGHPKILNHGED